MARFDSRSSLPALSLGLVAIAQGWMYRSDWPGALPGLFYVSLWLTLAAAFEPLWERWHARPDAGTAPPWWRRLRTPLVWLAQGTVALLLAGLAWRLLASPSSTAHSFEPRVHVVGLPLFFVLYFLRHYCASEVTARRDPAPAWHLLLGLLALQSIAGLLGPLLPSVSVKESAARLAAVIALYLPVEWLASLAFRSLQPPRLRAATPFLGRSLLLDALLGGRSPIATLAATLRDSLGLELRGTWLARYLRAWLEPAALLLVLTVWLSGSVVVVPLGHEGVRVRWGRFQPDTLTPGLHLVTPWPVERVRLVPVARVDEFALGYETDLGGPLLWAEPHFAGERNLLVGDGEQAITFNVPIQFCRADALAAERAGPAAAGILSHLAYRELLLATAPRDAFAIMTADRQDIAAGLRTGLQAAADHLALGVRIHHVGLKDIHPAVEVAPAFQEVISAREQRRMMIDLARANRITALAEARSDADRARRAADGVAIERSAAVAGEAARLTGRVEARSASPELFDFQNRLALAEAIVPRLRLYLVRGDASSPAPLTLDLREGASALTP